MWARAAEAVGFHDQNYFQHRFPKRIVGMSPEPTGAAEVGKDGFGPFHSVV